MNNGIEFKDVKVGDLFILGDLMMRIENTPHGEANTVIMSSEQRGGLIYIYPSLTVRLIERRN